MNDISVMTSAADAATAAPARRPRRIPFTLLLGLLWMLACELFLFLDVHYSHRGRITTTDQRLAIPLPTTPLAHAARWVAINMTALVWVGYLIFLEGLLAARGASPVRKRPHHFFLLCLASIFIWAVFDTITF